MFKKILVFIFSLFVISGVYAQTLSSEQYDIEQKYGEVQSYDFNLEVNYNAETKKAHASWDDFPSGEGFRWYKLLYSTSITNPVYPNQNAIFVGTQRANQLNHIFKLAEGKYHYVRICAITENDSDTQAYNRYCSETQKIVVEQEDKPQVCTMEYAPVCGKKDGAFKTYSNNCMREAAGASKVDMKNCEQTVEPPKACTREYVPVCGKKDGVYKIYSNNCMREAAGASKMDMKYCEKTTVDPSKDEISYQMSLKIKALLNEFIKKLEAKDYSNEQIISTIDTVIERLEVLGKQEKYSAIVSYMIDILEEYRAKYEDDFSIFDDIFGEY